MKQEVNVHTFHTFWTIRRRDDHVDAHTHMKQARAHIQANSHTHTPRHTHTHTNKLTNTPRHTHTHTRKLIDTHSPGTHTLHVLVCQHKPSPRPTIEQSATYILILLSNIQYPLMTRQECTNLWHQVTIIIRPPGAVTRNNSFTKSFLFGICSPLSIDQAIDGRNRRVERTQKN